ncbi:MAG: cyclic nucleotide-binding domain-containing protein [Gammaproteobacteria bacterium]
MNADGLAYPKLTRYETDFSATVDEYDGAAFINGITADNNKFSTWNKYLSCLLQSYQILMSHFSQQDSSSLPEFRQYNSGDIIIEEGTEGNEVFTLLSGAARVMSEGKEVGIIKRDEIFGAIAALTNTPRNATIVATTDCDTLVAKSENFQSLLLTRPDIVHKLVEDMARTIVTSNQRIIELSKESD